VKKREKEEKEKVELFCAFYVKKNIKQEYIGILKINV
jgi:hypothetical protein